MGENAETGQASGEAAGDAVGDNLVEACHPALAEADEQYGRQDCHQQDDSYGNCHDAAILQMSGFTARGHSPQQAVGPPGAGASVAETLGGARPRSGRLFFAILGRSVRLQGEEKSFRHRGYLLHSSRERGFVGLGRLVKTRDLAHKLEGSAVNLLVSHRRIEVEERFDVSAHTLTVMEAEARDFGPGLFYYLSRCAG